jgi:hypothetical protein
MSQLEELRRREFPLTGEQPRESISDIPCLPTTFKFGEYIRTTTNTEEDKSTIVYKFGEYEVEIKLDPEGRFLYIKGQLTPKQKKYYKELYDVDEEFPKRPLE